MNDTNKNDSDTLSWSDIKARLDDIKAPAPAISGFVLQARYQLNIVLQHVGTLRAADEKVVRSMRKVRWCIAKIDAFLGANDYPRAFVPAKSLFAQLRDDDDYEPVSWHPRSPRRPRPAA